MALYTVFRGGLQNRGCTLAAPTLFSLWEDSIAILLVLFK